jgi:hypothetical protein
MKKIRDMNAYNENLSSLSLNQQRQVGARL